MGGDNQYMRKVHPAEKYMPYRDGETESQWNKRLADSQRRAMYERAGRTPEQDFQRHLPDDLKGTFERKGMSKEELRSHKLKSMIDEIKSAKKNVR